MATFEEDLDTDRDAVFLDGTGYGFAYSVTYTTRSGSASTITVFAEDQVFAVYDNKENAIFEVSKDDVASPLRGDRVLWNSNTWQVLDIRDRINMWRLSVARMQDTQ